MLPPAFIKRSQKKMSSVPWMVCTVPPLLVRVFSTVRNSGLPLESASPAFITFSKALTRISVRPM